LYQNNQKKFIFLRNVTSKISSLKCLSSLKTYGFHGEALYNIIHLSERVEIIVKSNLNQLFKKEFTFKSYSSDHYDVNVYKLDQCNNFSKDNYSTLIRVCNLFGKFPIRQNQLIESKSVKNLLNQLEILSLINFNVEFYLEDVNDRRVLFHSKRHTSLKERFSSLIGLKSNDLSLKHTIFKDNLASNFEIDGYVYLYSKMGINNNFCYNLNSSVASKYQFIFVNNFHVQNSDFYDLIASKLSSCKEFNIINSDPKQTVFCIVIKAPPEYYKIVSIKNKAIVEFHNQLNKHLVNELLLKYVKKFLGECGYTKAEVGEEKYNPAVFDDPFLLVEDLKNSRASKTFRTNLKVLQKDVKSQIINKDDLRGVLKCSLRKSRLNQVKSENVIALESTFKTMLSQNKSDLINEQFFSNFQSSTRSFDLLTKEMSILAKRDKWLNLQVKNKSTQTKNVSKHEKEDLKQQKTKQLKENWVSGVNEQGVEYFINLIDGTSTYDFNLAKRESFSSSSNYLFDEFLYGFFNVMNFEVKPINFNEQINKAKPNSINEINKLIEQMSLVKWRNQKEFYEKSVNSEANFNFDEFSSSIKINRKDLENLTVIFYLKNNFNLNTKIYTVDLSFFVRYRYRPVTVPLPSRDRHVTYRFSPVTDP
jgi:DNA mismatch repair ATPase MutL